MWQPSIRSFGESILSVEAGDCNPVLARWLSSNQRRKGETGFSQGLRREVGVSDGD